MPASQRRLHYQLHFFFFLLFLFPFFFFFSTLKDVRAQTHHSTMQTTPYSVITFFDTLYSFVKRERERE